MIRVAAAACIVLTAAAAAAPPSPAPSPSEIPLIGRSHSKREPCVVLRDLVAPSLGAAMDADAAFGDARLRMRGFDDTPRPSRDANTTLMLLRLERNVSAMVKDVRRMSDALGDPRLKPPVQDPQMRALREALQALYDSANEKLNALDGYVETKQMRGMFAMDEGLTQLQAATGGTPNAAPVLETPEPYNDQLSTPHPHPQPNLALPTSPPELAVTTPDPRTAALDALAAKRIVAIADICR
jgi:hypothetical protein